ncbi:MAG TPA: SH3 domain-containing protein [Chitinophagaceae bacterium]|nr:SH3 domain-containing protein [Chitinophagaceae bacterium]
MRKHRYRTLESLAGIFLLAMTAGVCAGQTPQQQFNRAAGLYDRQQYDSAAFAFEQLINAGYKNAILYNDAGNASYKAGRLGASIYYFNKAWMLEPDNPFIRENLQFANQHIADHLESIPPLFFVNWAHELGMLYDTNTWMIISVSFFWVCLFFMACRWLLSARRGWTIWLAVIFAIMFAGSITCGFYRYKQVTRPGFAIVMQPEAQVREAPDTGSSALFGIHEGLRVRLLDTAGNWEKIRLEDGRMGWTSSNMLKTL